MPRLVSNWVPRSSALEALEVGPPCDDDERRPLAGGADEARVARRVVEARARCARRPVGKSIGSGTREARRVRRDRHRAAQRRPRAPGSRDRTHERRARPATRRAARLVAPERRPASSVNADSTSPRARPAAMWNNRSRPSARAIATIEPSGRKPNDDRSKTHGGPGELGLHRARAARAAGPPSADRGSTSRSDRREVEHARRATTRAGRWTPPGRPRPGPTPERAVLANGAVRSRVASQGMSGWSHSSQASVEPSGESRGAARKSGPSARTLGSRSPSRARRRWRRWADPRRGAPRGPRGSAGGPHRSAGRRSACGPAGVMGTGVPTPGRAGRAGRRPGSRRRRCRPRRRRSRRRTRGPGCARRTGPGSGRPSSRRRRGGRGRGDRPPRAGPPPNRRRRRRPTARRGRSTSATRSSTRIGDAQAP